MSAEMAFVTDSVEILIRLLGEGTLVYRSAPAVSRGVSTYLVLTPEGYDPDDETWEFPPGSLVECRRQDVGGMAQLVAYRLANRAQTNVS